MWHALRFPGRILVSPRDLAPTGSRRSSHRRAASPRLEALEGRALLSTFLVSKLDDSGNSTLRQAILDANAHPGADVIKFASELHGTITLTSGRLNVTDDLTVYGPGAAKLTVSGNRLSGVLGIDAGDTVRISDLTIAGGRSTPPYDSNGGAISNGGTLTVSNCVLSNNFAYGNGGAISNGGTLTVRDSSFTDNIAREGFGGAISNGGTLTVRDSAFTDNFAHANGGAISSGGMATVSGSIFTGDSTFLSGGGAISNGGTLTVRDSSFTDNSAFHGGGIFNESGGTATVCDSAFTGNSALSPFRSGSAEGGGIFNESGGTATVCDSAFTGNSAGYEGAGVSFGGGISNHGTATVSDSAFTSNRASNGGAISNGGTLMVGGSTITGNLAAIDGGGIFNIGSLFDRGQNTITDNSPDDVS